jgi:L-rhamnose isomerase/sugar isomerase
MKIDKIQIQKHNDKLYSAHQKKVKQLANEFPNVNRAINKLVDFQIAIPELGVGYGRYALWSVFRRW